MAPTADPRSDVPHSLSCGRSTAGRVRGRVPHGLNSGRSAGRVRWQSRSPRLVTCVEFPLHVHSAAHEHAGAHRRQGERAGSLTPARTDALGSGRKSPGRCRCRLDWRVVNWARLMEACQKLVHYNRCSGFLMGCFCLSTTRVYQQFCLFCYVSRSRYRSRGGRLSADVGRRSCHQGFLPRPCPRLVSAACGTAAGARCGNPGRRAALPMGTAGMYVCTDGQTAAQTVTRAPPRARQADTPPLPSR